MAKIAVAPLVGAWIEIMNASYTYSSRLSVAPLVGAWIEICEFFPSVDDYVSLPSWERGLK